MAVVTRPLAPKITRLLLPVAGIVGLGVTLVNLVGVGVKVGKAVGVGVLVSIGWAVGLLVGVGFVVGVADGVADCVTCDPAAKTVKDCSIVLIIPLESLVETVNV